MGWWLTLIIVLALLLIGGAILASRIHIEFRFRRAREDDRLELDVKALFGFLHYRYEVPRIDYKGIWTGFRFYGKGEEQGPSVPGTRNIEDLNKRDVDWWTSIYRSFKENVRDYKGWVRETLARLVCTGFRWSTSIGAGNPTTTAVLTGAGWGVKAFLIGRLTDLTRVKAEPILLVSPVYNRYSFSTDVEVIMEVRLGSLVASGWSLLRRVSSLKQIKNVLRSLRRQQKAASSVASTFTSSRTGS
ncbi:DUF2953 domain-containing protein [Gorillibacterium sp. CAU 1737]|uniref:DUF2953 domain-containing protein n=1 Tax=Gorillibacterium sp. CAU 1737 TaxID=3140362 RepID=UPI003260EA7F